MVFVNKRKCGCVPLNQFLCHYFFALSRKRVCFLKHIFLLNTLSAFVLYGIVNQNYGLLYFITSLFSGIKLVILKGAIKEYIEL